MFCLNKNNLNMTFGIIAVLLVSVMSCHSLIHRIIKSECKQDMTSCKLYSGEYGCCPLPLGECCADGLHCCPNGTECDVKQGSCHQIKELIKQIKLDLGLNKLCPNKNQTCHQFETCCKERTGSYGCCPYNLAVCCKDLLHCCPHGTTCDLIHQQCVHPSNQIDDKKGFKFTKNMRLIGFETKNITDIVCPGLQYSCPDGNTCCPISDTLWGCCPSEKAVCCADRIHCCPNGYKCTERGCH